MVARGWSEAKKRAYILADNKLALNAGWDEDAARARAGRPARDGLRPQPDRLRPRTSSRRCVAANAGLTDPDEVPEAPERPVTRPGDVWLLGRHRLVCGDCTDAATWPRGARRRAAAPDGHRPALWRGVRPGLAQRAAGRGTKARTGKVLNDDRADWREAWALFPGDVAYVWHGALHAATVAESLAACGFEHPRARSSGPRTRLVIGPRPLPLAARALLVRGAQGRHGPLGRRPQADDRLADRERDQDARPGTARRSRSSACAARSRTTPAPGRRSTSRSRGSGTTIIAAEMTGRACHAIELDPAYVDVAVARWQAFTGRRRC